MAVGKIYMVKPSPIGRPMLAIAALGGFELELPAYTHYEDNKKPEFLSKFPHGKIPAFEGNDGFVLTETIAIARYLSSLAPNAQLLGSNAQEAALIDQWMSFAVTELDNNSHTCYALTHGYITPYNKLIHQHYEGRLLRSLRTLNAHLATRTYLVTERITSADLLVANSITSSMAHAIGAELRKEIPHVIRHTETIANHPKLKEVYGELTYLDKALQYVPPPKEKKESKAPAPEKKAKPAKPAKEVEAEDDDDDDDKPVEEPKAKNPLDSLPKSTFNLEDWKRAYSNLDTRGKDGSLEWFYERFDKEGFSIWRVDYKYPEDLTQVFMSSNLIGGFFNRLEASRKYLFGSLGVLGESNNSLISGAFILRGQDHLAAVDCAPDWESYNYKPLDLEKQEDKEFFEAALAWDLEVDGKKWADGKNFK